MRLRRVLALLLLAGFAGGFVIFAERAARFERSVAQGADGVVVLTGGVDRIAAGAELVADRRGARLLITGVNEKATREDMLARNPRLRAIADCCLDLGYRAQNTVGNALEARDWASRNGYRSLILVTAASHMPRAMAEFAHAMPTVAIRSHAVGGERLDHSPWWRDPSHLRVLGFEYVKYALAAARIAVEREPGRWLPGSLREPESVDTARRSSRSNATIVGKREAPSPS